MVWGGPGWDIDHFMAAVVFLLYGRGWDCEGKGAVTGRGCAEKTRMQRPKRGVVREVHPWSWWGGPVGPGPGSC